MSQPCDPAVPCPCTPWMAWSGVAAAPCCLVPHGVHGATPIRIDRGDLGTYKCLFTPFFLSREPHPVATCRMRSPAPVPARIPLSPCGEHPLPCPGWGQRAPTQLCVGLVHTEDQRITEVSSRNWFPNGLGSPSVKSRPGTARCRRRINHPAAAGGGRRGSRRGRFSEFAAQGPECEPTATFGFKKGPGTGRGHAGDTQRTCRGHAGPAGSGTEEPAGCCDVPDYCCWPCWCQPLRSEGMKWCGVWEGTRGTSTVSPTRSGARGGRTRRKRSAASAAAKLTSPGTPHPPPSTSL